MVLLCRAGDRVFYAVGNIGKLYTSMSYTDTLPSLPNANDAHPLLLVLKKRRRVQLKAAAVYVFSKQRNISVFCKKSMSKYYGAARLAVICAYYAYTACNA